ncbi:MAG: hypothetical protein GXP55_25790, partial [Deltaproteobacteria bacterium]|nr:hypothetical protein [Deltaproteobacteria bacterium]
MSHSMRIGPARASLGLTLVACSLLWACGDDSESERANTEATSGAEDTGDGAAAAVEAPPGSSAPDDGSWDGDAPAASA